MGITLSGAETGVRYFLTHTSVAVLAPETEEKMTGSPSCFADDGPPFTGKRPPVLQRGCLVNVECSPELCSGFVFVFLHRFA